MDPLDEAPPGLNVLDSPDRDLGVDQLVGIFRRVFERFWGPRTDDILRAALLTLSTASPTSTLADVPRLLTDRDWQAKLAAQIKDPVLGPFWEWYGELSDPLRAQASGPLLNKLRAFLLRRPVRAIVGAVQDDARRSPRDRRRDACCSQSSRRARSARTQAGCSARSSSRGYGRPRSPAPRWHPSSARTHPVTSMRSTTT